MEAGRARLLDEMTKAIEDALADRLDHHDDDDDRPLQPREAAEAALRALEAKPKIQ